MPSERNRERAREWRRSLVAAPWVEPLKYTDKDRDEAIADLLDALEAEARQADEAFMYRALQWVERGGNGPNFTDPLQCMSAEDWERLQRIAAAPPPITEDQREHVLFGKWDNLLKRLAE